MRPGDTTTISIYVKQRGGAAYSLADGTAALIVIRNLVGQEEMAAATFGDRTAGELQFTPPNAEWWKPGVWSLRVALTFSDGSALISPATTDTEPKIKVEDY